MVKMVLVVLLWAILLVLVYRQLILILTLLRFVISSSDVGVIAMGSNPVNFDNGKGVYMSGDGNFLLGDSHGERMDLMDLI